MTRIFQICAVAATASSILLPLEASAQSNCAAGIAANGECVNASMAAGAVQTAVIFSQPKISLTAYPVLPSLDRLYRYPNELNPTQLPRTPVGPGPFFEGPGSSTGGCKTCE